MDLYQIWFRGSSCGRNQLRQILLLSALRFRFCRGSIFAINTVLALPRSHSKQTEPITQPSVVVGRCNYIILLTLNLLALPMSSQIVLPRDAMQARPMPSCGVRPSVCVCVCVCLSVCHVRTFCQNEHSYPQTFFTIA